MKMWDCLADIFPLILQIYKQVLILRTSEGYKNWLEVDLTLVFSLFLGFD